MYSTESTEETQTEKKRGTVLWNHCDLNRLFGIPPQTRLYLTTFLYPLFFFLPAKWTPKGRQRTVSVFGCLARCFLFLP